MQFSSVFVVAALAGTAMGLPMVTDSTVLAGKSLERRLDISPVRADVVEQAGNIIGVGPVLSNNEVLKNVNLDVLNFFSDVDNSKAATGNNARRDTIIRPEDIGATIQKGNVVALGELLSHNEIAKNVNVQALNIGSYLDNSVANTGNNI